jgi:hypothetical protein
MGRLWDRGCGDGGGAVDVGRHHRQHHRSGRVHRRGLACLESTAERTKCLDQPIQPTEVDESTAPFGFEPHDALLVLAEFHHCKNDFFFVSCYGDLPMLRQSDAHQDVCVNATPSTTGQNKPTRAPRACQWSIDCEGTMMYEKRRYQKRLIVERSVK